MRLMKANSSALWKILFMMTVHNIIEEPESWNSAIVDFYHILFSNDNEKTTSSNGSLRKQQFKGIIKKVQQMTVIKKGLFFLV